LSFIEFTFIRLNNLKLVEGGSIFFYLKYFCRPLNPAACGSTTIRPTSTPNYSTAPRKFEIKLCE
jgi:hypothetical protein